MTLITQMCLLQSLWQLQLLGQGTALLSLRLAQCLSCDLSPVQLKVAGGSGISSVVHRAQDTSVP